MLVPKGPDASAQSRGLVGVADLVADVELLGLRHSEAVVYVHLLLGGPGRASQIAQAVCQGRAECYRLLHSLVERGLAESKLAHPTIFRALPPGAAFESCISDLDARRSALEAAREEIESVWEQSNVEHAPDAGSTWRLVYGRAEILAQAKRIISGAHEAIDVLSTHHATLHLASVTGLLDALEEHAAAGVSVRAILDSGASGHGAIAALQALPGVEIRFVAGLPEMSFFVVDARSLWAAVVASDSRRLHEPADVALCTDAATLVHTQCRLFEAMWAQARA